VGRNLADKSVLVIGAGGLGGPVALVLAAAGVGRIVLLDEDEVEVSNLNRQPLFGDADLGRRKAEAARERLARLHPEARVDVRDRRFAPDVAEDLARGADVLVDASDNFATRFLANDAAVAARRPLVHGAVLRYTAQFLTVMPGKTGCLRCLFEGPPAEGTVPTCAQAGVLGALAGFAGGLMAAEALRLLAGERGAYAGRLVAYDARTGKSRLVPLRIRASCPTCGAAAGASREATP
jgi:molybdopterin/thiamine biosynthesis adenylyltransferase